MFFENANLKKNKIRTKINKNKQKKKTALLKGKSERSDVQDHPWLHDEYVVSLRY